MNYPELRKLNGKLYFNREDIEDLFSIKPASAKVLCSRYVKNNYLVRIKKDFYSLSENWATYVQGDFFAIANILQVPSYISLMTALAYYEITTQVQRNYFESIAQKRTLKTTVAGVKFDFYKFKKEYYFDFVKKQGFFIATKEKAFIDAVYLYSLGRYPLDVHSLDLKKLDIKRVSALAKAFPLKTRNMVRDLCRI